MARRALCLCHATPLRPGLLRASSANEPLPPALPSSSAEGPYLPHPPPLCAPVLLSNRQLNSQRPPGSSGGPCVARPPLLATLPSPPLLARAFENRRCALLIHAGMPPQPCFAAISSDPLHFAVGNRARLTLTPIRGSQTTALSAAPSTASWIELGRTVDGAVLGAHPHRPEAASAHSPQLVKKTDKTVHYGRVCI